LIYGDYDEDLKNKLQKMGVIHQAEEDEVNHEELDEAFDLDLVV